MNELVVNLDGKSEDFILGLEAGKIWNLLGSPYVGNEVAGGCHAANKAVLQSIAASKDFTLEFTDAGDGVWLNFTAYRDDPKPHLRVVQ